MSANTDFRLAVGYFEHPKIVKLERRIEESGVLAHIRLLRHTTVNHPDGVLVGMDIEDIEIAAKWCGEDGAFVAALLQIRLLDESDGTYTVHDWADHNPWACGFKARSLAGKKAAVIKWATLNGVDVAQALRDAGFDTGPVPPADCDNTNKMRGACEPDAERIAETENRNAEIGKPLSPISVSDSDSVSKSDSATVTESTPDPEKGAADAAARAPTGVGLFIDHFRDKCGGDPHLLPKQMKPLTEAFKTLGVDRYTAALRGYFSDSWASEHGFDAGTFLGQSADRWTAKKSTALANGRASPPDSLAARADNIAAARERLQGVLGGPHGPP